MTDDARMTDDLRRTYEMIDAMNAGRRSNGAGENGNGDIYVSKKGGKLYVSVGAIATALAAMFFLGSSATGLIVYAVQRFSAADLRMSQLEQQLASRTANRYTSQDHYVYCLEAQILSGSIGYECPEFIAKYGRSKS